MLAIPQHVSISGDGGVVRAVEALIVNALFDLPGVVAAVGAPQAGGAVASSLVIHMYNDPFIVGHPRSARL